MLFTTPAGWSVQPFQRFLCLQSILAWRVFVGTMMFTTESYSCLTFLNQISALSFVHICLCFFSLINVVSLNSISSNYSLITAVLFFVHIKGEACRALFMSRILLMPSS